MGIVFGLLSKLPAWTYIVVGLVIWGGYGHLKSKHYKAELQEIQAESIRQTNLAEAAKRREARKVEDAYAAKVRSAATSSAALADNNSRLQQLLSQYSDTTRDAVAVCGTDGARGRKLEELLERSATLAAEGARRTERLGIKVEGLQEYIRQVCVNSDGTH